MGKFKESLGKRIFYFFIILVLLAAAMAVGYYLSLVRFDKKYINLNDKFDKFESRYELVLSTLNSDIKEMEAYLKEKEGKAEEEANQLMLMSILLKAKGEIISSKLSLSREEMEKSLEHLDSSISVLGNAYDLADEKLKEKIEDLRLRLATVKGVIEVNATKAENELDKLWREIDGMTVK